MNNGKMRVILAGLMFCAAAGPVLAREKPGEEQKLEASAAELNKEYSEGQGRVEGKLKSEFKVDDALLMGLHFKKMNNGDIAIALGLAMQMHRGISDKNLHAVVALREGPPVAGWGKVAKDLGLKLAPVTVRLKKISAEVRKQEKTDMIKKAKEEKAEKLEKAEKNARPENTEKAGMKSLSRP